MSSVSTPANSRIMLLLVLVLSLLLYRPTFKRYCNTLMKSNNQMIPVWRRTHSNISLRCCKHDFCARALKLTSQSVILPASTLWSTPSPSRSASSSWRLSRTCHWGWHRLLTLHCGSPLWRRRQDFSDGARSLPFSLSLLQPDTVDLNSKLPITALRPSGVF